MIDPYTVNLEHDDSKFKISKTSEGNIEIEAFFGWSSHGFWGKIVIPRLMWKRLKNIDKRN